MALAVGLVLVFALVAILTLMVLGLAALRDIAQAMHGTNSFLFLDKFTDDRT